MPSLAMNRSAGDVDSFAAAPETADHRQADYFLRLLTQSRRLIDRGSTNIRRRSPPVKLTATSKAPAAFGAWRTSKDRTGKLSTA